MATLPFVARVVLGASAVAADSVAKLPSTVADVSQKVADTAASATVKINDELQNLADRGDDLVTKNAEKAKEASAEEKTESVIDAEIVEDTEAPGEK